jgi:hypothetical protein
MSSGLLCEQKTLLKNPGHLCGIRRGKFSSLDTGATQFSQAIGVAEPFFG